ncbi:helix-turn-helix domain-containing protein [Methylocystis sp. IM3]|uniref:GlxA family transcriptional regulator n=1 Tax=unclassified Methylocystis TaxID=2625913 RepID=UPI0030F50D8A
MNVVVLGYRNCIGSAFLGAADLLTMSLRMLARPTKPLPFELVTASFSGASFEDGSRRRLEVDRGLESIKSCNAIIIPGYICDGTNRLDLSPEIGAIAAWLRRQHALGATVCASCNGVFILGEAGLLDRKRCTTTWWRHDDLKSIYPRAQVVWGASLVEDNRIVTAGGPLSWIDLSLRVVRSLCGDDAAKKAADFTVVDTAPSTQTVYVPPGHLAASNQFLLEAERVIRQAGDAALTARQLAIALNASERTLHRRLREISGETPKHFIDRVRLEKARTLLETTGHSIKELAQSSGYADQTSFRRAFLRYSGMTPGAYRTWIKARNGGAQKSHSNGEMQK